MPAPAAPIEGTGLGKVSITVPVIEQPAAIGVLDEKQGKVIPFLYDPITAPYPVIQVSVNGHFPLPFILDAGTNAALTLNPWAAKELGLNTSGAVQRGNGFVFTQVPIRGVVLQGLEPTSNADFDVPKAFVVDLNFLGQFIVGQRVAGVVGLGMLGHVTARFDFSAKTMTVFTFPHPPLRIPGGAVLPLTKTADSLFTVRAALTPGTYADLIVDTGSTSSQLPLSALKALHPTALAYGDLYVRIDGIYSCPELRMPNLRLEKTQIPDVVMGTLPPPTRLSLGMDILAGYRMTLDGPNEQLILEPAVHNGRYVGGWSGLFVKQFGDGWAVDTFRGKSPARQAGLKARDILVTVDGVSAQGLSETQIEHLLAGVSGRRLQVSVRRGQGQEIALSWLPLDDFSAPHYVTDGLIMDKSPKNSWAVIDVVKGSPDAEAGLLAGDTLMKLDGEATANMSIERFMKIARQTTVIVEVERPGVAQPFTVRLTAPK